MIALYYLICCVTGKGSDQEQKVGKDSGIEGVSVKCVCLFDICL